jgi:hypothetical protein
MQCRQKREKTTLMLSPRRKCKSSAKRKNKQGKEETQTATPLMLARSLMHRFNAQTKQKAIPRSMRKVCRIVMSSSVNREFFWS